MAEQMTTQIKWDIDDFWRFCRALSVETKEEGVIKLGNTLLGSQEYFIEEVFRGLNEGIHYFVCLKGRQLGISTICLALDLYWHFKFPGMQGTLATDTEENREMFRSTLTMYMEGLPIKWKQPVKQHNRTQVVLGNRSRMVYQVAGTRKNVGFGAGKAITFMHATECGKWGTGTDLSSLEASLAETNPKRLYIFESTAYGYNGFSDMWDTAEIASTQRAIFVGWWRNKFYKIPKGTDIYNVYWDGSLTTEEEHWVGQVKEIYGYEVDDEQIAWWRFKLNETMKGDETMMYEKYPPTAEYAFVMTGSQFFSSNQLTDRMKVSREIPYECKRFVFGQSFGDTVLVDSNDKTATLKIWQPPVAKGQYVLGADPAWGSSDWADRFVVNVSRCWADGIEQVAEFCTSELNTMQFAWVLCYLAGAYGDRSLGCNVMINLEINGPGQAVWSEMQTMKRSAGLAQGNMQLAQLLGNIENFLYRRPDSLGGGFAYHTQTSNKEKERMFNIMKDHFEFGTLKIVSEDLLDEMKNVVREDGFLGAPGRGKDDRVIGQALSMLAWSDFIRMRLIQMGITKAKQEMELNAPREHVQAGRSIENYLKRIGLGERVGAVR